MAQAFAVFFVGEGFFEGAEVPAVRRNVDGFVAFPGGKVDKGEGERQALIRECREEGWIIAGPLLEVCRGPVEGREVVWFTTLHGEPARMVAPKAGDNSSPIFSTKDEILSSSGCYQGPLVSASQVRGKFY